MNLFEGPSVYDPYKMRRGEYGGAADTTTSVAPVAPYHADTVTPMATIPLASGSTPDYGALIKADPGYQSYLNNSAADVNQASAARREVLRKLAIQYGGLPQGFTDKYGDIDQSTLDMASQNQYSDVQRLGREKDAGIEAFKRALAARGGLQSGELGYGLDKAQTSYGEREYDMGNAFGNAAQGAVNDYLGVEGNARRGEAAALSAAQSAVYNNPANRPTDGTQGAYVDGSNEQYGFPVYKGPDNKLYKVDGTPFDPYGQESSDWQSYYDPASRRFGWS